MPQIKDFPDAGSMQASDILYIQVWNGLSYDDGKLSLVSFMGSAAVQEGIIGAPLTGIVTNADGIIDASTSIVQAIGFLEYKASNALPSTGGTITGDLTVQGAANFSTVSLTETALTYAATTNLDFGSGNAWRTLTLSGNVSFTTTNRIGGREISIKLVASGGPWSMTFPAWVFVGGAAPSALAAGKTAILSLRCFGTLDTDVVASYAVQA